MSRSRDIATILSKTELVNTDNTALSGGGGSGVTTYTSLSELPLSNTAGDMAFVDSSDRLYISNGQGWYSVSLINASPQIISVLDSDGGTTPFTLATDGSATVITVTAQDSDGFTPTYSYSVTSGSLTNGGGTTATVSQNGNVFTITPTTTEAYAGTFELTFTASDGIGLGTNANSFTLEFIVENSRYTSALISTFSNNGNNTSIIDAAQDAYISVAGNASAQSFSPYRSGGYSVQLDGTSGWIDTGVADNFGTGDVTFECWVKTTGGGIMLAKYQGGNTMEAFQIATDSGIMASHTATGTEGAVGTKDLRDNQWHHLVFERYNGTYYYYADGELQGTVANTENAVVGGNWIVGKHGTADIEWYDGQIRDLKLTVGTAVYGGSTPSVPTEPVTIDGSETLVLFTGIPYGKDLSPNNGTLTFNGGVTFVPEGPYDYLEYSATDHIGSISFDGATSDYLSVPDGSYKSFSTNNFTVEFWMHPTQTTGIQYMASDLAVSGNNDTSSLIFYLNSGVLSVYIQDTTFHLITGSTIKANQWYHVALVRNGTTITLYLNGKVDGTYSIGSNSINESSQPWIMGRWIGGAHWYYGYISDFKILNGTATYTSDFTPPTSPLSSTGSVLHIKGNTGNIIDKSQANKITLSGNTISSTTQTKYSTRSIYMDGTGDYVKMSNSDGRFNLNNTEDFTIEFWSYVPATASTYNALAATYSGSASGWAIQITNGYAIWVNFSGDGGDIQSAGLATDVASWHHYALVGNSGVWTLYIDGTSAGSVTNPTHGNGGDLYLGCLNNQYNFQEQYIEDFRFTRGLARYTSNFTPPTASLKG